MIGSSEIVLMSKFKSGSDPTIDIVETAGSDKESKAETGDGVEAMEGMTSGDIWMGKLFGTSGGTSETEGVVTGAETDTGGRQD